MKTYSTVEAAVQLVIDTLEANYISSNTECIRNRVYSWYNHSDVTDPEILAACALEGKDWYPGATYQDMLAARDLWFPQDHNPEFAIWEFEASEHDAVWQE